MKWKLSWGYPKEDDKRYAALPLLRAPLVPVESIETASCLACGKQAEGAEPSEWKGERIPVDKALDGNGAVVYCGDCGTPQCFVRREGTIKQARVVQ